MAHKQTFLEDWFKTFRETKSYPRVADSLTGVASNVTAVYLTLPLQKIWTEMQLPSNTLSAGDLIKKVFTPEGLKQVYRAQIPATKTIIFSSCCGLGVYQPIKNHYLDNPELPPVTWQQAFRVLTLAGTCTGTLESALTYTFETRKVQIWSNKSYEITRQVQLKNFVATALKNVPMNILTIQGLWLSRDTVEHYYGKAQNHSERLAYGAISGFCCIWPAHALMGWTVAIQTRALVNPSLHYGEHIQQMAALVHGPRTFYAVFYAGILARALQKSLQGMTAMTMVEVLQIVLNVLKPASPSVDSAGSTKSDADYPSTMTADCDSSLSRLYSTELEQSVSRPKC